MKYNDDPDYRRIIESRRWRNLRKLKLKLNPVCERCAERGRYRGTEVIHHVIPVPRGNHATYEQKKAIAYDLGNLQSLCKECHHLIHDEELQSKSVATHKQHEQRALNDFMKKFFPNDNESK